MNDKQLMQSCVNEYDGQYGKVKKVFDQVRKFRRYHVEGRFGYLNSEKNTIYITFRGSDGLLDWADNFRFWKRKVPYAGTNNKIKVHTGFIDQYKSVQAMIHREVEKYKRIIITGHSLGGSLATLCALDMQYHYYDKEIECVTFGSPRVGNKHFAKSFNRRIKNSRRYVYADDMVCKVPLSWMFLYKHVDKKIQLGKRKWYYKLSGNPRDHYPQLYLKYV